MANRFQLINLISPLVMLLLATTAFCQTKYDPKYRLPEWVMLKFDHDTTINSKYKISEYLNPFYLEADFDGDSSMDIAIAIQERGKNYKGILILSRTKNKYFILGAGNKFGRKGGRVDFDWLNNWLICRKKTFEDTDSHKVINLTHPTIFVEAMEKFSAIIYWDGKKYMWAQQGI